MKLIKIDIREIGSNISESIWINPEHIIRIDAYYDVVIEKDRFPWSMVRMIDPNCDFVVDFPPDETAGLIEMMCEDANHV